MPDYSKYKLENWEMKNFAQIYCVIKKLCIFAVSTPNSFFINIKRCSYFYGYSAAIFKNIRLFFLRELHLLCCNLSLATWGKIAFLLLLI
jgi:hypothetical protein